MKHANMKQLESLILLIDFKKAFDSLTHKYIDNCLKMFNLGDSIRRWVKLFFSNREAYILLGGWTYQENPIGTGGPPGRRSLLLIKINHTKNLKGITYAKKESRSETFDDTNIFIQRNPKYLRECVTILKQFANVYNAYNVIWRKLQLFP